MRDQKLPWAVWDGHIVTRNGSTDCVAFNVGHERARFIVDCVNERQGLLDELERFENTPPTWAELDNLAAENEDLRNTIEWHKKRDEFLLLHLDHYVRCACGSKVPKVRLTWAHPTCYQCLLPPPPIPTLTEAEMRGEDDEYEEYEVVYPLEDDDIEFL